MSDPVDREFRLALWKLHVLHHAERGPVYGLWLLGELAEHRHRLSPGTLYPILERMERNGWLRSRAPARANARRDYRITAAGRRVLGELRADVDELHRELVLGIEPRHGGADRSGTFRATRAGRAAAGGAQPRSSRQGRGS